MTQPNIVMILVDDLGWTDLTCNGSSFYETPNIDALAAAGCRFTQAYAAAPVCSPSRAALMSGKYPARVGVTNWIGGHAVGKLADVPYFHELPINEYSLARALRDGGYRTWHVGKWHLGGPLTSPEKHGFDVNIGGCRQGSPTTYFSPYDIPALPDGPRGEYLTTRLTDEAVALIDGHDGHQPFFLNLWHYTVHTPCQAPDELVAKYVDKARRLGLDPEPIEVGEPMPTWHQHGERVRRRTLQSDPVYAAMVETLDDSVGAVVRALRDTGRLDDTVIIVTSDNGGLATAETSPTCNAPLAEGKGWMADGGIRVPLVFHWPSVVPAGEVSAAVTTTPDLYPTILGLAGIEPAGGRDVKNGVDSSDDVIDGVDIWPAVLGGPFDRGPIFWHYPHYSNQGGTPGAAVRHGRWKLVRWFEDGHEELFDLENDVGEQRDLSASLPGRAGELARLLDRWSADVRAITPRPNPVAAPWPAARRVAPIG